MSEIRLNVCIYQHIQKTIKNALLKLLELRYLLFKYIQNFRVIQLCIFK